MTTPPLPTNYAINYLNISQGLAGVIGSIINNPDGVLCEEPEVQGDPRPALPYVGFKIQGPAKKNGDDSKDYDANTQLWNSGGVREMTVVFNCYGRTHEEAYSFATLLQAAFDLEDVQETLRVLPTPLAVWTIREVADVSQLLNTVWEGRARLEITFGVASNIESDLGYITQVTVDGEITEEDGQTVVDTTQTVTKP